MMAILIFIFNLTLAVILTRYIRRARRAARRLEREAVRYRKASKELEQMREGYKVAIDKLWRSQVNLAVGREMPDGLMYESEYEQ